MGSNQRDNKHRPYDIFCAVAVNERFFHAVWTVGSIAMKGTRHNN